MVSTCPDARRCLWNSVNSPTTSRYPSQYAWRYRREGPPGGSAERWIVIKPHLELRTPIGCCWGADPLVSRLGPPTWLFGRTTGNWAEAEWRNSWTSCF